MLWEPCVVGSNPTSSPSMGGLAQVVEQRFIYIVLFLYSSVVQSVERKTVNLDVGGSSPSRGASKRYRALMSEVIGTDLKVKLLLTLSLKISVEIIS